MATPEVEDAVRSLRVTAAALADAWSRAKAAIDTEEGGIGDPADLLARTFRNSYDAAAQALRTTAEHEPVRYEELADAAQAGVETYLAHDQAGRDGFSPPR